MKEMDQMKTVAMKNASGMVVGLLKLAEDSTGPLDALQRTCDAEMRGNCAWSPFVDHDAAKRALDRAKMHGRLFVTWATAEEIRDFELRRIN
jgi:hypothetical protein